VLVVVLLEIFHHTVLQVVREEIGVLQVVVAALVVKATLAAVAVQVAQQLLVIQILLGKVLGLDLGQYHDYI